IAILGEPLRRVGDRHSLDLTPVVGDHEAAAALAPIGAAQGLAAPLKNADDAALREARAARRRDAADEDEVARDGIATIGARHEDRAFAFDARDDEAVAAAIGLLDADAIRSALREIPAAARHGDEPT